MRPLKKPPIERDNWHSINEGQRRYAYEQYNLARVRRGLPIDHPIPEREEGGDDFDRILEQPQAGEDDVAREIEDQANAEREAIEIFDEALFDEHSESIDNQQHSTFNSPIMEQPGTSAGTPTGKRSGGQAGNASKRLFSPSVSSSSRMKLPGTGQEQGSSGGPDGPARQGVMPVPRPSIHDTVRYYRKVHRFLSFGISYAILDTPSLNYSKVMSTPLLEIPWDRLYLYLNPSELALLPVGASVRKVSVEISSRNVRVAFPTNSSETALATLNQNKNLITAVGLNKKMEIQPVKYAFSAEKAAEKMTPIAYSVISDADHTAIQTEMYGSPANINNTVPRHQMGQPQLYNMYAGINYYNYTGANQPDGWPCLQCHVREVDADAATNVILSRTYHPKVGLCKPPPRAISHLNNLRGFSGTSNVVVNRGSHNLNAHQTAITIDNTSTTNAGAPLTTNDTAMPRNQTFTNLFNDIQLIEKSQILQEGLFQRDSPEVQDSVHVGVQPVLALTTDNLQTGVTNQSFLDVQGYFEIVAECEIDTSFPTFRPLTTTANVHVGNMWTAATTKPNPYLGTINGLYFNAPA